MQISKDSWHYKLNMAMRTSFEGDVYRGKTFTTCSYIRQTIFSMILALLFMVAGVGIAIFAMAVITGMLGVPVALAFKMTFESAVILHVLGIGLLAWIIAGIGGLAYGLIYAINWIGEWNTKRGHEREYKASLVKQALQDRKDGICTIVTFK